jgi:hypothetical protein
MKVPAWFYRKSKRRLPATIKSWKYPAGWVKRWVKGNGEINWRGQRRFVGEAFVNDYIGLKPVGQKRWKVYFGPVVIGELRQSESGAIRAAKYRRAR